MNKKGEGGQGLVIETLIKVVLTVMVLIALWSLAANFVGMFTSDEEEASIRNFERFVATLNAMDEGDYFSDYPLYLKDTLAIVGWQSGKNANTGTCDYGTIEAVTIEFARGLPKPPKCGDGTEGCVCLCEKTSNYEMLCQDQDDILACATFGNAEKEYKFYQDLSFIGCAENTDHDCDFALLLGTGESQAVFVDMDKDSIGDPLVEFSLFDCNRDKAGLESGDGSSDSGSGSESIDTGATYDYGDYNPTTTEEKAFAFIDTAYGAFIDAAIVETPFDHDLIVGLIMTESSGNPTAVSLTSCRGVMQFCSPTAYDYGLCDNTNCDGRDEREDPAKAIPAGVKRLQTAYDHSLIRPYTTARLTLALASYNGGEGTVGPAAQATGKSDPTWDEISAALTWGMVIDFDTQEKKENKVEEIRRYVPRVLTYAGKYQTWKESQGESEELETICRYDTIVAIGASNTQPPYSYVHKLESECPESNTFVNAGFPGHGPAAQLARFEDDVIVHEPNLVIISPSGNGLGGSTYASSVVAMAEIAQEAGADVLVLSVSPRGEVSDALVDFNKELLSNKLDSNAITSVVDIYTPLADDDGICGYCIEDDYGLVHWSTDGHEVVKDAIWETFLVSDYASS